MAKDISTGLGHLVKQQKEDETHHAQLSKRWKELRAKIDQILVVNNVLKTSDLQHLCIAIDTMPAAQRDEYITQHWGPLYLDRVRPLLQQLTTVETDLAKVQERL